MNISETLPYSRKQLALIWALSFVFWTIVVLLSRTVKREPELLVKVAIGIGVLIAVAAIAGIIVAIALVDDNRTTVTLRLLNDTHRSLTVRGCNDQDCFSTWLHREVGAGLETDADVDSEDLVDLFEIERPGPDLCLPVRIHDGYLQLGGGAGALAVRLSEATPCPGTTVLPEPTEETPL